MANPAETNHKPSGPKDAQLSSEQQLLASGITDLALKRITDGEVENLPATIDPKSRFGLVATKENAVVLDEVRDRLAKEGRHVEVYTGYRLGTDDVVEDYRIRVIPPREAVVGPTGEIVDSSITLLNDPERGSTWQAWMEKNLPKDVYRDAKLVDVPDSEEWVHLVEHNLAVAAASLTLGKELQKAGVDVNLDLLLRASIVHDSATRLNKERQITREQEGVEGGLKGLLKRHGYSDEEIEAAQNTGRLADRYVQDPKARKRFIADHTIEANILAYCDGRTIDAAIVSVDSAKATYLDRKLDEDSQKFFNEYWDPYFRDLESHLFGQLSNFSPGDLTPDRVFATVQEMA